MSENTKVLLKICLAVIAISAGVGGLFGLTQSEYQIVGFWRGALAGALISAPIATFELFYASGRAGRSLREGPLWRFLLVRTGVYTLATLIGEFLSRLPFIGTLAASGIGLDAALLSSFVFTMVIAAVFNFLLVVNQLLGKNVLFNLVTGRYHRPRQEVRVFLFADMVGSTGIAEQIGNQRFLQLLNSCFFDITEPVLLYGGEIYRYVGDEVIVTWKSGDRVANARAFDCVSAIEAIFSTKADEYWRDFGVSPSFRMALHSGSVVAGEIGDYKREITFLGDVVNTTARIVQACRELNHPILASGDLVDKVRIPAGVAVEPLGAFELRGKTEKVELYSVRTGTGADIQPGP